MSANSLMEISDQGHTYSVACLTSIVQMAAIKDEWKHLERTCAEPYTYFQSFDWCYGWCREKENSAASGDELEIRIYTVRREGELAFVMPMMVQKSGPGIKCLTFLTEPLGQYGNVICNRKLLPVTVGNKFWNWLEKNASVDVINLNKHHADSFLADIVGDAGFVENSQKHASVLDLDAFDTWQDYQNSLSAKTIKKRNRLQRKLENRGQLSFDVHIGGSDEYRENVEQALEFKQVWLRKTGRRAAVLSQDFSKNFLIELPCTPQTDKTPPQGAVVCVLKLDGKAIGVEIGMCLNGHYYCYLGSFDWGLKNLSPGKVQMEMSQEWAKSVGVSKFDFLGDPADYMSEWVNNEHLLQSRSISLGVRGYIYSALWKAKVRPAIRSVFNNMNSQARAKLLGLIAMPAKLTKKIITKSDKSL